MKKLFTLLAAAVALQGQAQTLMVNDFENGDGGAYVATGGSCEVFDNPATDGLNTSAKALKVTSTEYAQVGFPVSLPDGKTLDDYTGIRLQVMILPGNNDINWIPSDIGVSQNKESMDILNSKQDPVFTTEPENVWVEVDVLFDEALLEAALSQYTSDERNIMFKLGRSQFTYAVDNIRLIEKEQLEDPNIIFTFETMELGATSRCSMPWGGSCEVVENLYTSGVTASQKALQVTTADNSPVAFTAALPNGKKWSDYKGIAFDLCITDGTDVTWAMMDWGVRSDAGAQTTLGAAYDSNGNEGAAYTEVNFTEWMKDITLTLNPALLLPECETITTLFINLKKKNITYMIDNIRLVPADASGIEAAEPVAMDKVYGTQGAVVVESSDAQTVNVYTIDGRLACSQNVEAGVVSIPLARGLYIVNGVKAFVY